MTLQSPFKTALITHILALFVMLESGVMSAEEDPRIKEALAEPQRMSPLKFALGDEEYDKAMATGEYRYVGNAKCRLCHRKFFIGRKKDPHDTTMPRLIDSGYTDEPRCLVCHSTGHGDPTGFTTIKETPRLANVQCEGCHGPGNLHVERSGVKTSGKSFLVSPYTKERQKKICLSCHTERWNRSYHDLDAAYEPYRNADPTKQGEK